MKIKNKCGYSLVEVVIALSVIVIVSFCALSIVLSSASAKENAIIKSHAQNFAENVWECFKAANDKAEFEELIVFAEEGIALTESEQNIYEVQDDKFTATIVVNYLENNLEVDVFDMDNDEIISFSYQKGGQDNEIKTNIEK